MKQADIKPGATYGNGATLRTVKGISSLSPRLAFTEGDNSFTQSCWLDTFARWARFCVAPDTTPQELLAMQAKSLRLSHGQQSFLKSLLPDFGIEGDLTGMSFEVMHTETRTFRALARKGVLTYNKDDKAAKLTQFGVAYLGLAHVKNQQEEHP